jgi:cysteine/O-acetylserine efflux protein
MAVLHGYRTTLKFQAGLAFGVFLLMLLSGWFSAGLLNLFPPLEPIMRYIGAGYILYLAYGMLKASYSFTEENEQSLGFMHGFMLQILNPKLFIYAFTLFSAFLTGITGDMRLLIFAAALLAGISFCATSLWALCGSAIKNNLHNPRLKTTVNMILSLSLVYAAITLL